jgi:hypothetical protein
LVAWDHAADYLELPPDAIKLLAASGDFIAILLYPAVVVKSQE